MKTAKVLSEDDLTLEKLKKFFESIYLNVSLNDRGYLIVEADGLLPVAITLDQPRKLLKFLMAYGNEYGQLALKHINRMNETYNLVRFSTSGAGDNICVAYHLPYDGGITPYQLLAVLRLFSRVASFAIHEEASQTHEKDPDCALPERVLN
jgi:hypothetical protein